MNGIMAEKLCEKLCLEEKYAVVYDHCLEKFVFHGYGKDAMSSKYRNRIALNIGIGKPNEAVTITI